MIDNFIFLLSKLLGYKSYDFLSKFMLVGEKGIEYYREAHLTKWNSFIHTLFMPFSMYGMLLWIPALLKLNRKFARILILSIYFFYGGHYLRINKLNTLIYYLQYYYTIKWALKKWQDNTNKMKLLTDGLIITGTGLSLQEILGHWFGGDIPSRFEAIPNAILYSMYFASSHFLR